MRENLFESIKKLMLDELQKLILSTKSRRNIHEQRGNKFRNGTMGITLACRAATKKRTNPAH